jgi:hypothetical protein
MRRRILGTVAAVTLATAVLALALVVGVAAGGNGHGHGNGNANGHRSGHASANQGQTGYHFLVLDAVSGSADRLIIQGDGSFNANRAHGGGTFDHFQATGSPPLPLVASGTWKATDVVSFNALTPTHGVYEGGTLVMHATFFPNGRPPIPNVLIQVDCNLGPAGVNTGKPEGVVVTIPGPPQILFAPTNPTTGVTVFSLGENNEDDGD